MMADRPQDAVVENRANPQPHGGGAAPAPHFDPSSVRAQSAGQAGVRRFPPSDHDLTVIVPAYNEAQRLPRTLDGLAAYLDQWGVDYRVLVVDDGSHDGTAALTAGRGGRFSAISQPNRGKGAAVRNGMLRATGRFVAFTDADLPYDLDALKSACELLFPRACDVVFGARDLQASSATVPQRLMRTLAHTAFSAIVRLAISRQVTDTQCGLKAFSRRAALEIFSRTTIDGFAFDAEIVFLTHWLRIPFSRVPVTLVNEYGSSISLSRHALPMLGDVLRVKARSRAGRYPRAGAIPIAIDEAPSLDPARVAA